MSAEKKPAVVAKGLSLELGGHPALVGVDLELAPGARLSVLGASGAGKTSLLRLIAGLATPSAGRLELAGELASEAGRLHLPPEGRQVGFVFQDLALWPHLSVAATLTYVAAGTSAERRTRALALADQVGLARRLEAFPDELSGGEQQRLALARALASDPHLLLLDEPFAHLDPALRDALQIQLLELSEARPELTLIAVTHQAREALTLGQELLILGEGRSLEHGPASELVERPRHARTIELLGLGAALVYSDGACALGPVALREGSPVEASAVLVRPSQVRVAPEGVEGRVRARRLQPNASWRVELELSGGGRVGVELAEAPPLGAALRVVLDGPCWGLPAEGLPAGG